jgi:tRNA(adenine34) deaminase
MLMTSKWMEFAIIQADEAKKRGEVPIGAVLVREGQVIAAAGNRVEELSDPTAHAEMLVNGSFVCPYPSNFLWSV